MRIAIPIRRLLGVTVAVAVCLAGPVGPAHADQAKPVRLTEKDNDGAVSLAKGQELVVSLGLQTGTGYTWQVAGAGGKLLEQVGKPVLEWKENKPGAPAAQVFRFKASEAGTGTLELHYLRPFEKEAKPARKFQVKVTVKE